MMAIDDCMVANGCAMLGSECWQRKEGFLMDDAKQYPDMGPYVPVELKKGDMLIYGRLVWIHMVVDAFRLPRNVSASATLTPTRSKYLQL